MFHLDPGKVIERSVRAAVFFYKKKRVDEIQWQKDHKIKGKSNIAGPFNLKQFWTQAAIHYVAFLENQDNKGKEFPEAPESFGKLPNSFRRK